MDQATEDELFWSDVSVRKVTSGTQLKCFKEVGNVKGNLNSDGAVNSCTPMAGPRKSPSDELPSCHSTANYEHRDDQKVDVIEDEVIVSRAIVDLSIARAKQQFAREELATSVDSNINIDLFVKDYVQEVISGAILVYFGAQM
uniref:Uncharacterized protein LOC102802686 n=1 Tax=Saccoglossus kowalevskii TaxID=10224 RepID=A0ABM0MTR5_SACKO|nr:PREDICTED: uncharacterized protein LOC102802686 [Saccoglossus kowalevskii]